MPDPDLIIKAERERKVSEKIGYVLGKVETIRKCLLDIDEVTEFDIWGGALNKSRDGVDMLDRLAKKGYIR